MRHLVYNVRCYAVPVNSSLSTITLYSSVKQHNISIPVHDVISEFDCTCIYIYIYIYICIYTHTHTYTHAHTHIHTHAHTHIHTRTHTHIHTRTHTHTQCLKRDLNFRIVISMKRMCQFFSYLDIIIVIIRHELGLNRPVSASSNRLFKVLPSSHMFDL